MLQQQKFMLGQAAEEQKVARTRKERERKLAVLNKEIDAIKNNPELKQNSFEVRNMIKQLQAGVLEIETELEINPVDIQKIQSDYLDKDGKPIETQVYYQPDGKAVVIQDASKIAAQNLEKDKFEQSKIDAARKANHEKEVLAVEQQNAKTARLKEENSAAAQSNTSMNKKLEVADKLQERKREAAEKRRDKIEERFRSQQDRLDTKDEDYDQKYADLEKKRFDALEEFDQKEAEKEWKGVPYEVPESPTYRPTRREVGDEIRRRNLLNKDDLTEDELDEQVQYDSPMDPEFSDEQFAGTEPAGLYDPTGQPLPMDGGMYNGLA